jgi:alcohol dehydrogenase (cytochrome c)
MMLKAVVAGLLLAPMFSQAQGLDPRDIVNPKPDEWPTYSGDYSGRRFSSLTAINESNVKNLSLAWATRVIGGEAGNNTAPKTIVGGNGTVEYGGKPTIKGGMLQVEGVLYFTIPDNVWAVDARDGHEVWHFFWKTRGGDHIGNRGVGIWHDNVYFETADDFLLCLDRKTGKLKWQKEIASFDLQYFSTMAPIVVGNHVLVGTGDNLDEPGLLQSFNADTGEVEWKWYSVPMKEGDPGLDTWKNLDAAQHGGGNIWVPGSYDPETHLYIFGTANPTAAYTSQMRGPGANLFTCSLVAVNVDTGKMAWYYQTSPHDTHDFDSAQTPVLVDGDFNGRPRKLVMTASRNGYFFVLDRVTGEHLLTSKLVDSTNWAKPELAKDGSPVREPKKDFDIGGALVSPGNAGVVNWPPPAYSPQTGLFYVNATASYAMYYLTTLDPRGAMALGGKDELSLGSEGTYLLGIDYKTGKATWRRRYPGIGGSGGQVGVLTTAGHLLFSPDPSGNLVAYKAENGTPIWESRIGASNAPETYMLDGQQYVIVAGGDTLFAFRLN